MFDAEDKRTIVQLAGVWILALAAIVCTVVVLALSAGVAVSVFKFVGGL